MKRFRNKNVVNHFIVEDLLQYAILPAVLMVGAKILSFVSLAFIENLQINIIPNYNNIIFPFVLVFSSLEDKIFIISYSNFFMFLVVFIGCMAIAFRSTLLVRSKSSTRIALKLARYDLLSLIYSSYETYKELFVWSVFLIISCIYLIFSTLFDNTYPWMANLALVVTLVFFWIIIKNIQTELYLINKLK